MSCELIIYGPNLMAYDVVKLNFTRRPICVTSSDRENRAYKQFSRTRNVKIAWQQVTSKQSKDG